MNVAFLESFGNGFRVETVSGVEAKVTDHDEMWFLNMLTETENEIEGRQSFGLMTSFAAITDMGFVVEGYDFSVIRINAGGADAGTTKIAGDVLHEPLKVFISLQVFGRRRSTDNEAVRILFTQGFFDGSEIGDVVPKLFQENILKGEGQEMVIDERAFVPGAPFHKPAFSGQAMDVRIPVGRTGKGVKNANHTRGQRTSKPMSNDGTVCFASA